MEERGDMEPIFHMQAVNVLRKGLKGNYHPYEYLEKRCVECHTVVNAIPRVEGFIMSSYSLDLPKNHYLFCIFLKIPDQYILFVSEEWYSTREKCRKELKTHLNYFPLYGFSSRFVF